MVRSRACLHVLVDVDDVPSCRSPSWLTSPALWPRATSKRPGSIAAQPLIDQAALSWPALRRRIAELMAQLQKRSPELPDEEKFTRFMIGAFHLSYSPAQPRPCGKPLSRSTSSSSAMVACLWFASLDTAPVMCPSALP